MKSSRSAAYPMEADQAVLADDRPVIGGEQVDAGEAHARPGFAQIRQGMDR